MGPLQRSWEVRCCGAEWQGAQRTGAGRRLGRGPKEVEEEALVASAADGCPERTPFPAQPVWGVGWRAPWDKAVRHGPSTGSLGTANPEIPGLRKLQGKSETHVLCHPDLYTMHCMCQHT